jgi:hypothetical protein
LVQVLRNQREITVKPRVATTAPIGLSTQGYSFEVLIENNGQAEKRTKEIMANTLCMSELLSWLGVVKKVKP